MSFRLLGSMTLLTILSLCFVGAAETATASTTLQNLHAAYTHEQTSESLYSMYAAKADEEGYKGIAVVFRATANAKSLRVGKFANAIKIQKGDVPAKIVRDMKVAPTVKNLTYLIVQTKEESTTLYAAAAAQAEAEKLPAVVKTFKGAAHVSGEHLKLYEEVAKNLDAWKVAKPLYVCQVCAWIGTDPKLEACPVCKAPKEKFTKIE